MASPQTKKGYLRLANELAEAIYRFPFSAQELRVVMWSLRASYGWGRRDTPPTSVRALAAEVRIPIATAGWALRGLVTRGIILRMQVTGGLRLNKNYEEWLPRRARQLGLLSNTTAKSAGPSDAPAKRGRRRAAARAEFKPPTIVEVKAYCVERKNAVDPEKFWHHYEATGWKSGRHQTPVTNWKSLVCYWERTEHNDKKKAVEFPCPICDGPMDSKGSVCCRNCRPYCRLCGKETLQLRVYQRPDNTKSLRCKGKCSSDAVTPPAGDLAKAAIPQATRAMDAEKHERFMDEHRARSKSRETSK